MPRSRTSACIVLFAAAAAVVAGCKKNGTDAKKAMPPPQVVVAKPVPWKVQAYREYNGYLESIRSVEIKPQVSGILEEVHFREGDEVKQDAPLFTIDPREYKAAVAKGVADVAKAAADIENWKAQIERDEAELERVRRQFQKGAGSQSDVDRAVATVKVDRTQVAVGEASKAAAEASLETANLQLGYTRIKAPITGRISSARVYRGNLVQKDMTLLTTIVPMDPIYVIFDAPEQDVVEYQRATRGKFLGSLAAEKFPIEIGVATEPGFPHRGTIDFRENRVDVGTGTIRVRGELPNADRFLYPGLYARVRTPLGDPRERLSIPEDALMAGQEGRYVYVVKADDTVEKRVVTVGPRLEESRPGGEGRPAGGWKLVNPHPAPPGEADHAKGPHGAHPTEKPAKSMVAIDQGLEAGDRVIVDGLLRARPGTPVSAAEWAVVAPPGAASPAHGPANPILQGTGTGTATPPGGKK